jgi:ElaB protein
MESKKNLSQERDRTTGGATETTSTTGQGRATGGQTSGQTTGTSTAPQRARQMGSEAQQAYDQTRQAVSDAYERTSETLSQTYDQAMSYGREHPGQLTLIAFGAGIGVGLLLATGFSGRSRSSRIIEPVGQALTQIAAEIFR